MLDLLGTPKEWERIEQILLSDHRWYRVRRGSLKVLLDAVVFEEENEVSQHMLWVVKVGKDEVRAVRFRSEDVLY